MSELMQANGVALRINICALGYLIRLLKSHVDRHMCYRRDIFYLLILTDT